MRVQVYERDFVMSNGCPAYGPKFEIILEKNTLKLHFDFILWVVGDVDHLCGPVVRIRGYRSRGPGLHFRRY
jgi:hypothetical protein